MKTMIQKIVGLALLVTLSVMVFAGCGPDTSTAAGSLQATLTAMKNGNFQQLSELTGEDFSQGDWDGIPAQDMQRLFRAMFGNITVEVKEKETSENTAVVTVKGETGDLSSVIADIGKEASSDFLKWCEENKERLLEIKSEEMRREMMSVMVEAFEKYSGKMERKPVDTEIQMTKNSDGQWVVDSASAGKMAYVVFGSETIENIQSLLKDLV